MTRGRALSAACSSSLSAAACFWSSLSIWESCSCATLRAPSRASSSGCAAVPAALPPETFTAPPPAVTAPAACSAAASSGPLPSSVGCAAPPRLCCTTWASSCDSRCLPSRVSGAKRPREKAMWGPTVSALADRLSARSAARGPSCSRTAEKSWPKRCSISRRREGGMGAPEPPDKRLRDRCIACRSLEGGHRVGRSGGRLRPRRRTAAHGFVLAGKHAAGVGGAAHRSALCASMNAISSSFSGRPGFSHSHPDRTHQMGDACRLTLARRATGGPRRRPTRRLRRQTLHELAIGVEPQPASHGATPAKLTSRFCMFCGRFRLI